MKLKVWLGATLNEATDNLTEHIDNSDMGIEHIVIVPDAFSMLMERKLLSGKRKAMFNISVMGLTGLAVNLLQELGEPNLQAISKTESLMLVSNAIDNKMAEFEIFGKNNINFCHEIYKVIAQLQSSGVKPDDLLASRNKKFRDIGRIYAEYQNLLGQRNDANSRLEMLCHKLSGAKFLQNKVFYFAQFDAFTHQTYEIIKALIVNAREVNISVADSISKRNAYIYEKDILEKLTTIAKELGVTIELEKCENGLSENSHLIASNLYGIGKLEHGDGDFLNVIGAQSRQEEIETIARFIKYKVVKGAKYRDFAVACAKLDAADSIEKTFSILAIPFYVDKAETADRCILSNFIFEILEVLRSDYSFQSLQTLASNLILGDGRGLCARINQFNIRGKERFKRYLSGSVLDAALSPFEKTTTFSSLCQTLRETIFQYEESYSKLLTSLEADMAKEFNINVQAKDAIFETLEIIERYKGNGECSKGEFLKELKLLLSFKEISSVPTYLDAVFVGDATSSYYGQVKNLIVEGGECLPLMSSDNSLLSDDEIDEFALTRKIEPSIRMLNRRNRFKLFNLLCSAENLTICFLKVGENGEKIELPSYISSLLTIFDKKIITANSISRFERNGKFIFERLAFMCGGEKFALEALAENPYAREIASVLESDLDCTINKSSIGVDAYSLFFPQGYTKATQLETYFSCPFKHFITYGLRATEEESVEFDYRDIGNICHKFAEMFVKENMNSLGSFAQIELPQYINKNFKYVVDSLKLSEKLDAATEKQNIIEYISKIVLLMLSRICSEQSWSTFRPLYLEKSLGGINFKLLSGKKIDFIGKIDRIDIAGKYFRIMDYKTGSVHPMIKDLYYGDKLQLVLYENAAAKFLGKTPSGAFYFDCRYDFDEAGKADVVLKGLALGDEEVLKLYDSDYSSGRNGIIGVHKGSKGQLVGEYAQDLVALENYALKISQGALEEIEKGYIEPKPDEDACRGCPYFAICSYDKSLGLRRKTNIKQEVILKSVKGGQDA